MDHAAAQLARLRVGEEKVRDLGGQPERHQLRNWQELCVLDVLHDIY